MLKVQGLCQIVQSGVWRQNFEILNDDRVIGFVDYERTRSGIFTTTRNLRGDVMEGECLEWLLRQTA
jgi:hypothetical protein